MRSPEDSSHSTLYTSTMKQLVKAIVWITATLGTHLAAPAQDIGVNFNGVFSQIDEGDLLRTRTKWIRGFVDYFEFKTGVQKLVGNAGLAKLHIAHIAGYKTIINVKFNFEKRNLPTTSAAIQQELNYLNKLLSAVYQDCDILVAGNEPFIESKMDQRDSRLSNFYIAVARKVNAFIESQPKRVPLYVGSFDNIWKTSWQTVASTALLQFANSSSWIAGIDLHIHHTQMSDIDSAFAYVNPKIRQDQKILVTEFSLKNLWKEHLKDPIPTPLAKDYKRPSSWLIYEYLNYTIHHPVSREEWVSFLSNCSWFESNKKYVSEAWAKFKAQPKFSMATYGMYQNAPEAFTATTDPWILNPLFVNTTVLRDPKTNLIQTNYAFFDEFLAIHP